MNGRASTLISIVGGLLLSTLAACGGGGGGGGYGSIHDVDTRTHCELLAAGTGGHHQLRSGRDPHVDVGQRHLLLRDDLECNRRSIHRHPNEPAAARRSCRPRLEPIPTH